MPTLKPPGLRAGDTIGVVAPSFPLLPAWRDDYEQGKNTLRAMGFEVREGRTLGLCRHWAAGTPGDQAADINAMFADPAVKAIIAHSGGFPGMSVLDRIGYAAVRAHPKPFLGMGDIWPALAPSRRAYLTGLYRRVLTSPDPVGPIVPGRAWECWRAGRARGPLIGGCLKRITALAATPYFPPDEAFDGAILFWEEIGRDLWDLSIDLHILKHRGILGRIAGMLIGKLTWINTGFEGIDYPTVRQVVFDAVGDYSFPIMANVDVGHQIANIPLPIGVTASFDAEATSLALVDAAVA